ncbi:hypothetical protein ABMA28_005084 [Loxostege sticticalis]|uniref:RNA-directed DNA polymerase n=1 Tax=Loxostege sticticalis TaxID=481309 RepID=A0ABD0SP73_LOXSC
MDKFLAPFPETLSDSFSDKNKLCPITDNRQIFPLNFLKQCYPSYKLASQLEARPNNYNLRPRPHRQPSLLVPRARVVKTNRFKNRESRMSLTEAQFEKLLTKIGENRATSTLAQCSARYGGSKKSTDVETFLAAVNVFKKLERIEEKDALTGLPLLLTEDAAIWWQGVKAQVTTWADFEAKLRHTFAPKKPPYVIYQEIVQVSQAKQTTESFIAEKRALIAQLPEDHILVEDQLIDLVYGQIRFEVRERMVREHIHTFDELLEKAREVERHLKEKTKTPETRPTNPPGKSKRCAFCRLAGHTIEVCRKKAKADQAEAETKETIGKAITRGEKPKFACYGCGEPGVIRSRCPKCATRRPINTEDASFCGVKIGGMNLRPVVRIQIGHIKGTAQIDTGARSNVASYSLYRQLQKNGYIFNEQEMSITLADGIPKRQMVLTARAPVTIYGRVVPSTFVILPQATHNITLLGVGFIMDAMLMLNIPQMTCRFLDEPSIAYDLEEEDIHQVIIDKLDAEFTLPQMVSPIATTPEFLKSPQPPVTAEIETLEPARPVTAKEADENSGPFEASTPSQTIPEAPETANIANASTPPRQAYGPLIPLDLTTPPNKRPRLMFDGHSPVLDALYFDAENSLTTYDVETELPADLDTLFEPGQSDIASINLLSDREHQQLEDLLRRNEDAFTPNGKPTTQIEHVIDTGSHRPISVPPYRLSSARTQILRQEVDKMIAAGIIQPCQSPWTAPVVMVPKKDGGTRVCVDYRQLNAITTPDMYPLPRIDDLLHGAKPTPYMTTIDLQSGYWQIKVQEQDQDKTCFVTPFGTYKFLRMPFGLRNAPATFQRLMDRFRISLSHIKILIYIDDVIVLSETYERHLKDLQEVFDRLREYNLTVNKSKCKFCCSKVKYLGHYITPRGLEVDPEKVTAITGQAEPKNVKHLLSFLQMCSWYRRFILNFAKKSEPLTRLTKKNARWHWTNEQQESFESLKADLVSAPVLAQADESKPYIVKTDASSYAIGAVLVQGEGENEHPVEYATLKWLMTLKSPSGRLARWALQLQAYDITIKYIKGKTNVVADSLSRPTCNSETQDNCGICSVIVDMPSRSAKEIRTEQLKDEGIKKIVLALEDITNDENAQYWSKKGYIMVNGLLYRYNPEKDDEDCQLVVPKAEQEKIISAYHDDPIAGHYGVEKTIGRISRRYYWKGMRTQIENYLAILVGNDHTTWPDKLSSIRFAMNTAISASTGYSPAYLTFGRQLRTPDDVRHDLKAIIEKENFIHEITPKLILLANTLKQVKEIHEMKEEQRKEYVDKKRKESPKYKNGDLVMVDSHVLSSSSKGFSAKLAPRRDGPYLILRNHGPSSFEIADPNDPGKSLGLYHSSALRPFQGSRSAPLPAPAAPLRKRGRPRKVPLQPRASPTHVKPTPTPVLASSSRRLRSQRGSL